MKKLLLIDGHSILNRAFFGLPDLTNGAGLHTNAVYGFLNILFKLLDTEEPDALIVAFDVHAPTFRHKMYASYKGTRKPMAEELRQQVPMMKQMLTAMGVPIVEKEGLEADDILGTIAKRRGSRGDGGYHRLGRPGSSAAGHGSHQDLHTEDKEDRDGDRELLCR